MRDITTILTNYRRPQNIPQIIEAIKAQTIRSHEIWVWSNYHEDSKDNTIFEGCDRHCTSDYNWKFFGRFAMATMVDTKYIAFFDDDTVPGKQWFENCLCSMEKYDGLMGTAGVILQGQSYNPHIRIGWPSKNRGVREVDLVGHAWFMKTEWLKYFWMEKPPRWDNAEDIHLSYMLQKQGIRTYCPPHPSTNIHMHGSLYGNILGMDDKAQSTNNSISHEEFFKQRDECIQYSIENGWKPLWLRK